MNTIELPNQPHRLLIIDDNPRIHEDIRKILCPASVSSELLEDAAMLFGEVASPTQLSLFEIDSAHQGQEGLALVEQALQEGRPYSMAFVDVRMPPGWDGIETIQHLWKCHPELQVVICTAYSDHSWDEIIEQLGQSDSLLILKKPFDNVEVLQLAHALTKKWVVTQQAKGRMEDLERVVERRTAELVRANQQLQEEINRRAEIEQALRESEERFHKAFDNALVALAILKVETFEHTDANESYLSLVGYPREQVLGKTPKDLKLPADPVGFAAAMQTLRAGQRIHNLEFNLRGGDGQNKHTLISVVPVRLGSKDCLLAAVMDVTQLRLTEAQLRQAQKMEAIGQLAAGVAHDFNNLLTIILGHASMQLMKASVDQEVNESFEEVKHAAERAAGLTRQLLAFSRKQVLKRSVVNLGDIVWNTQKMLLRLVGETISFEINCAAELPCVLADESGIEQILLNLVVNARDALPDGGTLSIGVEALELTAEGLRGNEEAKAGRYVVLSVADNGCGMDEETQRRLYEPFFTTKGVGKGTGLGLSTVYGIVKQHEGWIELKSKVGVGTTFRVFLPATRETPDPHDTEFVAKLPYGRDRCILVVEDEARVRGYVCDVLRNQGYKVLEADCGQKALELWEHASEEVELLLTDMIMPNGMSGGALANKLRHQKKDLKVIYMSGYSSEIPANGDLVNETRNFLPKPFSQGGLLRIVESAMAEQVCREALR